MGLIRRTARNWASMFPVFQSCNRTVASGLWCGQCPKCVSVFLTSYPFVNDDDLVGIFGHDLFTDMTIVPVIRALLEAVR